MSDASADLPPLLKIDRQTEAPVYRLSADGSSREAPFWAEIASAVAASGPDELVVSFGNQGVEAIEKITRELTHGGLRFLQLRSGNNGLEAVFHRGHSAPASKAALVLEDETHGQRWAITPQSELEIGRAESCDIRLNSPQISAQHCAIRFVRRAVSVVDLHSEAGTYIDNRRIHQAVVDTDALLCLGSKETGDYLEAELRIPIGAAAFLHIISGTNAGRSLPLVRGRSVLGRSPASDQQIVAPYISRVHARLSLLESIFLIEDLQSANGTWLNGRSITGARLLPGDRLRLAGHRFRIIAPESQAPPVGWSIDIEGRSQALDAPAMTLGRDPTCELRFDLEGLSRLHARLAWEDGGLRLYELAGIAAIAIEGRNSPEGFLRPGDCIYLGPITAHIRGPESA